MTIYQLSDEARALDALTSEHLTESGGELTPEIEAILTAWLSDTKTDIDKKLDAYAAVIAEKQSLAEARKTEAARYLALAKTDENTAKSLKERLRWFMETSGMEKHETLHHKFAIVASGGKMPVVIADGMDASAMPEHFQRISIDVDKTAILDFLESGGSLDWARLGERGRSLRIK